MQSLNIGLVFDPKDAAKFELYSQSFGRAINSDYILGVHSLVHVTILQIEADIDDVVRVVKNLPIKSVEIDIDDPYIHKGSGDAFWYGLSVIPSDELSSLQSLCVGNFRGNRVHNKTGSDFFPHVTTGHGGEITLDDMPDCQHLSGRYNTRLAIGVLGPNYQFEKIVGPKI